MRKIINDEIKNDVRKELVNYGYQFVKNAEDTRSNSMFFIKNDVESEVLPIKRTKDYFRINETTMNRLADDANAMIALVDSSGIIIITGKEFRDAALRRTEEYLATPGVRVDQRKDWAERKIYVSDLIKILNDRIVR